MGAAPSPEAPSSSRSSSNRNPPCKINSSILRKRRPSCRKDSTCHNKSMQIRRYKSSGSGSSSSSSSNNNSNNNNNNRQARTLVQWPSQQQLPRKSLHLVPPRPRVFPPAQWPLQAPVPLPWPPAPCPASNSSSIGTCFRCRA